MAWVIYDLFKKKQLNGSAVDLDTDTVKMALVTSSYTPDQAAHDFIDDALGVASANEVSGTNYSAGGPTLTVTVTGPASHVITVDASDVVILQSAGGFTTARYAVIYKDTGSAATSPVVAYYDLGANVGNVAGDLTFQFDAAGIATFT